MKVNFRDTTQDGMTTGHQSTLLHIPNMTLFELTTYIYSYIIYININISFKF